MNQQRTFFKHQSLQPHQLLTQQMPVAPHYREPPQSKTSPKNVANHMSWSMFQQSQQSVSPPRTWDDPYRCNFIGQLVGSYEIDSPSGCDQVSIIVPEVSNIERPYGIARRVCDDGEALPDQFVYEEKARFALCSINGKVVAVMPKGISMKHFLRWEKKDGSVAIWRRTGNIAFSLVSVDALSSCSRRNSICSVYSNESSAICSNSVVAQDIENVRHRIRPELRHLYNMQSGFTAYKTSSHSQATPLNCGCTIEEFHLERNKDYRSTKSKTPEVLWSEKLYQDQKNLKTPEIGVKNDQVLSTNELGSMVQEEKLFEQIKAHCVMNPSLLKRIVCWSNSKSQSEQMALYDHGAISVGRLWLTASTNLPPNESDEKLQQAVNDIKGAYHKVGDGVWQQPLPETGEPGLQHRLRKDSLGCWVIEELIDVQDNEESWNICAKELSDHRWVDMKNDLREIKVTKLQMDTILQRMMQDKTTVNSDTLKNYVDFLFKSCNQKKLNSKLKKRNLKHNISNLKVKLDKQYALSFAVKVANTADVIAQELGALERK